VGDIIPDSRAISLGIITREPAKSQNFRFGCGNLGLKPLNKGTDVATEDDERG
jgi:hypothetical protein